jgi:hypothetical protein
MTKFPAMGWRDKTKPSHLPKPPHKHTIVVLSDGLENSQCFVNTTGQNIVLTAELYQKGNTSYCLITSCWGISTARAGGGGYDKRTAAFNDALSALGIEIKFEGRGLSGAARCLAEEISRIFQIKTSVLMV